MDEFVLDLVEQCSFQKQRVMHLVMTSRFDLFKKNALSFACLKQQRVFIYLFTYLRVFCLEMRMW